MRQLLVINPNTSGVGERAAANPCAGGAGLHVHVRTVTARFGAPYIADEASYAVAVARHAGRLGRRAGRSREPAPDAVLIGCFGDPGLLALRESSPVPVTGLAEAAFIEAARHGRFAIVTGGERWGPMLAAAGAGAGPRAGTGRHSHRGAHRRTNWQPTRPPRARCWPRPAATRCASSACRP